MTNAEAQCNKSLRPRKPEGSLGRTAQDVHLDSHTAPELCPAVSMPVPTSLAKPREANYMQVCTHAKRSHTHVKDPVVHVGVRWIMETPN